MFLQTILKTTCLGLRASYYGSRLPLLLVSCLAGVLLSVPLCYCCSSVCLNCPCLCWLRDCVLSSLCPSLVRICPCDAHQWVNVGWRAPAFGFKGSPFTSCPCGLRPYTILAATLHLIASYGQCCFRTSSTPAFITVVAAGLGASWRS